MADKLIVRRGAGLRKQWTTFRDVHKVPKGASSESIGGGLDKLESAIDCAKGA